MDVKQVAVIGAGIMGRGIAHIAAQGGYQVALQDLSPDILDKARGIIQSELQKGISLGKLDEGTMRATLGRLRLETDLRQAAAGADLVIEAVPEEIGLKCRVFAELDAAAPAHAILASNTSALSITEMGGATKRPGRVVGMHFFNPPHKMKLVEVIRGLETSDETMAVAEAAARQMGREPVLCNESPAFIASRINALIGNEAFRMLQEGVASARDIDQACKLGLNHPMGPFELIDLVGLDTRLSILSYLHERLGERFRPTPLHIKYVKAGRLGRKTGKGVYDYTP